METSSRAARIILCVDHHDTKLELEIRRKALEHFCYRVLVASSPFGAVRAFRKKRVDVVLMEQGLRSSIGGPPLAAVFKRMRPGVPVVLYSADWAPSAEDAQFADLFLSKLVSLQELVSTIDGLLSMKRRASAA